MSLTIELSPWQEQLIREAAEREGVSVSEIARRTVEEWLATREQSALGEEPKVER